MPNQVDFGNRGKPQHFKAPKNQRCRELIAHFAICKARPHPVCKLHSPSAVPGGGLHAKPHILRVEFPNAETAREKLTGGRRVRGFGNYLVAVTEPLIPALEF